MSFYSLNNTHFHGELILNFHTLHWEGPEGHAIMMLLIYTFWYLFLMMDLIPILTSLIYLNILLVYCVGGSILRHLVPKSIEVQSLNESPPYLNVHGDIFYSVAFKNENFSQNIINEFHTSLRIVIQSFENKCPVNTCIWGFWFWGIYPLFWQSTLGGDIKTNSLQEPSGGVNEMYLSLRHLHEYLVPSCWCYLGSNRRCVLACGSMSL